MDADDVALPHRLERQAAFMEQHPDVGLVGAAFEVIDTKGDVFKVVHPPLGDAEIKATLRRYNPLCHPTVIMRKEVVLAVGGYRKVLGESEDYDLWLRISEITQVANLSEPLLRYRIHTGQVSVQKMRYQTECLCAAQASALRRLRGEQDPLSDAAEITPPLLASLGVTEHRIQQYLVGAHGYWMGLLTETEPEAALQISNEILRLCRPNFVGRVFVADAWLGIASIHYRQRRPAQALRATAHALVTRPSLVMRPLKRAVVRLINAAKG
jgi:hypothetical protein